MIDISENKIELQHIRDRINSIGKSLGDLDSLEQKLKELENKTLEDGFWSDKEASNSILSDLKKIKYKVTNYKAFCAEIANLEEINEFLSIDNDEELSVELLKNTKKLEKSLNEFEITILLSGKYDSNNAIITLHPGAGGTEAQDWVQMLYRMYCRWANSKGFSVKELDYLEGDEAGIKSVTALISGDNAYGYMKSEMGVHRLVRISPFDAGGRRHTSFASLEVLPEISDDIELDINPDDIKMDVYRASRSRGTTC